MRDFKALQFNRYLEYDQLGYSTKLKALVIRGSEVGKTQSVIINNISITDFAQTGLNELAVNLPESISRDQIRSVVLIAAHLSPGSKFSGGVSYIVTSGSVEGMGRLIQKVVKILIMSPGSSLLHPKMGGGLGRLSGSVDAESAPAYVMAAVKSTEEYIMENQSMYAPSDEILRALSVEGVSVSDDAINLNLRVESMAGGAAFVGV